MKQLKALHAMQDVAARRVTNIATRLRIPLSSRIHQRTAGGAEARHNPNRRPWDVEE